MIRTDTDLLRLAMIGSVDDGKSTLLGRLLFDTGAIMDDQKEEIELSSKRRGEDYLNLALVTDGLRSEREQGITIDVAYRYFSTPTRKFIVADCPGHIQYTRNMVTGTSNSQAAVILIDVRNGVVEQTRRHTYITQFMGVQHLIVCVNKMDLLDYDQAAFEKTKNDMTKFADEMGIAHLHFVPISALKGDNVVKTADTMPWYSGPSLLETLEAISPKDDYVYDQTRFPVQRVIRPMSDEFHDYRGYAGRLSSGSLSVGDEVQALPSGMTSRVSKIHLADEEFTTLDDAISVSICLEDDIDISRGDMIIKKGEECQPKQRFTLQLCWLDDQPFSAGGRLELKHGNQVVKAIVESVDYKVDTTTLSKLTGSAQLERNDIAVASIKTNQPIFADSYKVNRANGAVILISPDTYNTVAAGMVL